MLQDMIIFVSWARDRTQHSHVTLRTMPRLSQAVFLPLLSFTLQISALPISSSPTETQDRVKGWSKEAIFALLGIFTAIACFLIGLAWSRLRKRLHCCLERKYTDTQRYLTNWRNHQAVAKFYLGRGCLNEKGKSMVGDAIENKQRSGFRINTTYSLKFGEEDFDSWSCTQEMTFAKRTELKEHGVKAREQWRKSKEQQHRVHGAIQVWITNIFSSSHSFFFIHRILSPTQVTPPTQD
jgi:hypothetical protein